jgi:hypothetical protein
MSEEKAAPSPRGISKFQFTLVIVIIVLVTPILQQVDIDKEQLKGIGRACGAFAGLLVVWGFFSRMLKFGGLVLAAAVAVAVLVGEGVIKPPLIFKDKIEEMRNK